MDILIRSFIYLPISRDMMPQRWFSTEPEFDERRFKICDWYEFYLNATEALPADMPVPRGRSVVMSCFVDADHAGCRVTRQSHTGVIIFVNRAPILWFSKRQNTVESSTFGLELLQCG